MEGGSPEGGNGWAKEIGRVTARKYKHRIRELHDGKVSQVAGVYRMAPDTQQRERKGQAVHNGKQDLSPDDPVNQAREHLLREHGVFFHELRKVVEPRRCGAIVRSLMLFAPQSEKRGEIEHASTYGEGEEAEAQYETHVAYEREYPHGSVRCEGVGVTP